jgi:hypothetical protein
VIEEPSAKFATVDKFATMYARHFTNFAKMKPLFGKPYMMTGTLFGSLSFMFQTGCILGRHFAGTPGPFFLVYCVNAGHEIDGPQYMYQQVQRDVLPFVSAAKSFNDLIIESERVTRYKDTGPEASFVLRQMTKKVNLDDAYRQNWEWALMGSVFGMAHPDTVVELYSLSHAEVDAESWKRAHDAGLNIPAEQEIIQFDEQEQIDVQVFSEYVREFYPQCAEALGVEQ